MKPLIIILCLLFCLGNGRIFSHSKKFIYEVQYYSNELNITTNEIISLNITGNLWKRSSEHQEAIWQYNAKPNTELSFKNQFSLGWLTRDTTGIIENDKKFWMHPPRHNQYLLTEISPFPDFRKNCEVGDHYSSITYVGSGLGPWEGKKVKCTYSIVKFDKRNEDSVWTIKAISEIEGKINNCEFIFSNKKGFTSMSYLFFNGDRMTMKLKK